MNATLSIPIRAAAVVLAAAALWGCEKTVYEVVPVASVTIIGVPAQLEAGQTAQLSAEVKCAAGRVLSGRGISWSTSDAAVATVSPEGLLTAHKAGEAMIEASCEMVTGTAGTSVSPRGIAPGDWSLSAGAGLSGWFNLDGAPVRLTKLALGYDAWRCGGVTTDGWRTVTFNPPLEVVDRDVDLQLSFGSGDAMRFQGQFDDDGQNLSGGWSATAAGQSCSGNWTASALPPGWVPGRIGFSYSGHRSGSFDVLTTFAVTAIDPLGSGTWAVSFYDSDANTHDLMAQRRRPDGLLDFVWLWVPGRVTAPGTRDVVGGGLVLGYHAGNDTHQALYVANSGSVSFSSVTSGRVGGSFGVAMLEAGTEAALNVTGGTFNLPLVTDDQVLGLVGALYRPEGDILESLLRTRRDAP